MFQEIPTSLTLNQIPSFSALNRPLRSKKAGIRQLPNPRLTNKSTKTKANSNAQGESSLYSQLFAPDEGISRTFDSSPAFASTK